MTSRDLEELFRQRLATFEKLAEHEHRRAKELPEPFRGDVEGFATSLDRMAEEIDAAQNRETHRKANQRIKGSG